MSTAIYVINRRVDAERLARFTASAADFDLAFERICAFDGHDPNAPFFLYRDLLGDAFWGAAMIKPGAFACYISHATAWRRLLASGAEMALICEDDVTFKQSPHALFEEARGLSAFDVIFANERMAEWRNAAIDGEALTPIGDIMAGLSARSLAPGEGVAKAPGADCYLLSRAGAAKLLDYLAEDKVVAGVDWMMLRRSAGAARLDCDEWAYLSSAAPDGDLQSFVTPLPLVWQADFASVLSHKTEATIADLKASRAIGDGAGVRAPSGDPMDPVFASFERGEFYETQALEMMRRWMPEGGVFVDIGAHVGNHSLFMLRYGHASQAIPFEFNSSAIRLLTEMVEMNELDDQVDLQHLGFGLTEERGKREAFGSRKNLANNRLREGFVEKINTRPGDGFLRDVDIDMVKIDVNGDERDVLKGMRKTLKRKRPVLALDLSRQKSKKALPLLGRLGYVERERTVWSDAEGDRIVAIFTSERPATAGNGKSSEN